MSFFVGGLTLSRDDDNKVRHIGEYPTLDGAVLGNFDFAQAQVFELSRAQRTPPHPN